MSRGPGALQRWLLVNLPYGEHVRRLDETLSTADLAATYYSTSTPTSAQVSSVRRALRGLEDRGLAQRWYSHITKWGNPPGWTRVPE